MFVCLGTAFMGAGIGFLVRANLGSDPWTVFYQGVSVVSYEILGWNLTLGRMNQIFGLLFVVSITIADKIRPSFNTMTGTIINFIFTGIFIDLFLIVLPTVSQQDMILRVVYMFLGIVIVASGIGVYVGAGLGEGPIELLMMFLVRRTKGKIAVVKIIIDAVAVLTGYMLGGIAGVGTLLAVLCIGPIVEKVIGFSKTTIFKEPEEERGKIKTA